MIREIDTELIREDRLLCGSDKAPVGCNDCAGCAECCQESAVMIVLDEYDIRMLKDGLNYSFEGMLRNGMIRMEVVDGVVLPGLNVREDGSCVFLGGNGRCTIHAYRPGICRMYPLGRIYHEDGSFSYYLQEGECGRRTGERIRVSDWIGIRDFEEYEQAVRRYHDSLVELRESCASASHEEQIALQSTFLKKHFF